MTRSLLSTPAARRLFAAIFATLVLTLGVRAAEEARKNFDVPAGDAIATLKQAAQQGGVEIMFPAATVQGVKTNAVKGELSTRAALDRMLADTGLIVVQDEKTGALAVRRSPSPNGSRAAQTTSDRPAKSAKIETGAIKLETYQVLGSRIRQIDSEGPSPVNSYGQEDIRATGAMTLSDFLNQLPQTYGGISAGRGSAPSDLNPESGQRSESVIQATPATGAGPVVITPSQTGVSGIGLRGLGSGSTLVLIDGRRAVPSGVGNNSTDSRQGFFDLNTIPLGLIERIEVTTDGSSAIYGADAVAGVINIVLKKSYVGTEVSGTYKITQHGGGRERQATVTTGFATRKLRGTLSVDYYDRSTVLASQRDFSANLDHTGRIRGYDANGNPLFGTNELMQWGYPSTVQAIGGTVPGTFNAIPGIRVVLTPKGFTTTPPVSAFIPVTTIPTNQSQTAGINGQGQQQTNVAQYLELVPASQRYGLTANLTYAFGGGVEAFATLGYSDSRGRSNSLPPIFSAITTSASLITASTVPAAFNPFNQDVQAGMIVYEFGRISQATHTKTPRITAGLRGLLPHDWRWDLAGSWQRRDFESRTRDFNPAAFTPLLKDPDATQRYNPFIDAVAAGIDRTALVEKTAVYPSVDSVAELQTVDLSADGRVWTLPGGPIQAAAGVSYVHESNDNSTVTVSKVLVPVYTTTPAQGVRDSYAAFGELSVPVFGKTNARTLLRRLELRLAARYQDQGAAGVATVPKYGVSWSPFKSVLLRASYSEGFRVPGLTELQASIQSIPSTTLFDPRRGGVSTPVSVVGGINPDLKPETSTNEFYGVVFQPAWVKGLSLQVNYYRTHQLNAIQQINRQTLVNNEVFFADRITRLAPTAADIAANQPGALSEVRVSLINFGAVRNESMDFIAEYRLPWDRFGRWRLTGNAAHTLKAERELAPGVAPIEDVGDTFAGPKWKFNAGLFWSKGPWTSSANLNYLSGFGSNLAGNTFVRLQSSPPVRKIDVRFGYEFKRGVWHGHGKGLRLNVGVSNLLDEEPPFYDVIYGYNAGLHSAYVFGRSYEFSFALPL